MTWRAKEFRTYFIEKIGAKENSANSYASNLRKVDEYCGGLDEKIQSIGIDKMMPWAKDQAAGPFEGPYASNPRAALKRYLAFLVDASDPDSSGAIGDDSVEDAAENELEATLFKYEKELQAAIRKQIKSIGTDMEIADGGTERSVATGRIDILAKDQNGYVVIELKAGLCPPGAMEQVLGYTQDLHDELSEPCRSMLIAGDFSERMLAAAKRIPGLTLMSYGLQVALAPVERNGG